MRRVLVIGSGGAGKSTFARALGARTGLPVVHLDARYWQPGWREPDKAAWRAEVDALIGGDAWILDGNYGGTLDRRLAACDTAVFLDLPRLTCLRRVLGRWWRHRGRTRPDMREGCPERLSGAFLRWIWAYPARHRPQVLRRLDAVADRCRVVVLRSPAEVERFLAAA